MFYWIIFYICTAGPVVPDKTQPILLQWNNVGFKSRYVFSFWISSDILSDASVSIVFPIQYSLDLGISACSSFRITDEDAEYIPCTISSRILTLKIAQIKAGAHKFKIENILNPATQGTTGVFIVRTLRAATVIDENALYPSIGIAPLPSSLKSTLAVEGALQANYSPILKFQITPSAYYPVFSWMRIIFPSEFTFGTLSCYIEEWNQWVTITSNADSHIIFEKFTTALLPSSLNFDVYGVFNPGVTGKSGDIIVEILRENTFTVLARSSAVAGPTILAGSISKVQINGSPLMTDTPSEYTFNFLPYNTIPEGGTVSVKFPTGYNGLLAGTCLAVQGLKPAGSSKVTCLSTVDTVTFGNFKAVSGQTIQLTVMANNPSVSGDTGAFQISTYDKNSVMIDQNTNAGHVTISSVQYPEGFSVEMLHSKIDNPIGSYAPLDIFLHPRNFVPCTVPPSTYIYITIDCPTIIVAGAGAVSCTFGKDGLIASYCNFDPVLPFPQIQIKTPMTGVDCCPLAIKVTTAGVPSGFTIPNAFPGQYKFIARIYDMSNTQLEEAEYVFGTNPGAYSNVNFWYLHNTRDAWNVLKFDITASVDIPLNGMIEWEFQTSNHSFPRDLGWGYQSYTTKEFSCTYDSLFPDATPTSSIYCEITTGTTEDPVFVRMKGFNGVVTAGVKRWVHLSNVKNAPFAGFVPYFTMRTKDSNGVSLNEFKFSLPALIDLPTPLAGTIVGSSYVIDNPATEMDVSLTMSAALSGVAWVYIVFPHGYKWNHPNGQGIPIVKCAVKALQGPINYYEVFTQPQAAGILYTQTASDSVASPFQTCFKADHQSLWIQNPVIEVYIVVNQKVRDYYKITHGAVTFPATITFDGAMQSYTAFDKNTTNLWRLKFTQSHRITDGGSIQVLLPVTYFASVALDCYKIVNPGITCKGENFYNSNFHRMSLLGVTDHTPAVNLPVTYQLNPVNNYEVWFYATTGFTAGTANVEIFSQDEDNDIDKRIDQKIIGIPIADNLYPYYVSMDYLHTNYIEAYGSEPWNSFVEWGPIKIIVKPNSIFPETNTLYNTFITITFPCIDGVQYFTKNPAGLIQCRMNTLLDFAEEGYFGRLCTFIQGAAATPSTPCIPDKVTFYTPTELRVDPSLAAPFDFYEIELSTIGVTDPLTNGFQYPVETGYYRFIVNLNKNQGAAIEQAEPFLYVMEDRFTYLYTTSEHKRVADLNIMMFNFKLQHDIPSSNDPVKPGYLLLEFPFDYTGTGAGWASDLGTGIPDGGKIDCLQDFTIENVPVISPDSVFNENRVECNLKYGYLDYTTIVVKNIKFPNAGSMFNLYFGGLVNPSKNLYDFPIRIRTVYEDLTDPVDPSWVTLDTKLNTYVETGFNIGGGNGQTTTNIQDDYSTIVDPVHFVPGVDTLKVSFNIENLGTVAAGTWIWVQVPPGFRLPDWKNTTISLKVINGTEGGLLDSTTTCVPTQFFTWPETNLFKFVNCIALTQKRYTRVLPRLGDTPNRVEFYPITMTGWPADPVTFHSLVVVTRRSSLSRFNKFPTTYLQPAQSCAVSFAGTTAYGYYGFTEVYNFKFTCPSAVPDTGEYIIYFPLEFKAGNIDSSTCAYGATSGVTIAIGAVCSVVRKTELHISGFSALPINTVVDINVTVTNPPQGAMTNPYVAQRYVIASYNSTSITKGSFQVIDRIDPAGTAWFTDKNNPTLNPPVITADLTPVIYHESFPVANGGAGAISFTISSPITINKKTGYILISTYQTIALPTNAEIRCIWRYNGVETMADNCIFTIPTSSLLHYTIQMFAPTSSNIPLNVAYDVYITTVFANTGAEGILLTNGLVRYGFLVEVYASGGAVTSAEMRYLEMVGPRFPVLSVTTDQWTQASYSRFKISFQVGATSVPAAAGRIVIEFPTSPTGLFANDLGLGLLNNGQVPCKGAANLTPAISCFLFLGDSTVSTPAKVIVSGFTALTSGVLYRIELPKIYNPIIGGDDQQISLAVYALNVAAGWPGTFLYYREVRNFYSVRINVPTITNAANSATATATNDFTLVLFPISPVAGDYLAVELHSAASIASSSPVCKDASSVVIACTYYSGSNTVILDITSAITSITIFSIVNPLPSAAYLDFYIRHWSKNQFLTQLKYQATSHLPITVKTPDKTVLFSNDVHEYLIQFMPTLIVPASGSVVLEFPSEFTSLPDSTCYNYQEGLISQMSGPYTCTISGLKATISGFNQLSTGKNVVIKILAKNPSSALTTSVGIKGTTYLTTSATAGNIIETNTDPNTFTFTASIPPSYYDVPRQYRKPMFIVAGQYAPVLLKVSGFGSILADTGNLRITLNGFGTLPSGSEPVCLWSNKRSRCSVAGNVITIYAPENAAWSTYPVVITITSTNADNIDSVGVQHPNSAGQYRVLVEGDSTGDGIYETTAIDYLQVFPNSYFSAFTATPAHYTANAYNLFKFDITVTTTIPINGYIRIYFPTADSWGNSLFANDLGTGLSDGQKIPCEMYPTATAPASISGLYPLSCKLYLGSSDIAKPAYVELTNFQAITGGSSLSFVLWKVRNPANAIIDAMHIEIFAVSLSDIYIELDYFYHNYVMTVTNAIASNPGTPGAPYNIPTATGTIGNVITISVPLMDNIVPISAGTVYILEVSSQIPLTGVTIGGCVVFPTLNLIQYNSPPAGAAGSHPTLSFTTNVPLKFQWNLPVITCYQWNNKVAQRDGNSYLGILALTLATFTSITSSFPGYFNKLDSSTITFTPSVEIPAHGSIIVNYPTDYTLVSVDCEVQGLIIKTNYKCTIASQAATIIIYEAIAAGSSLSVITDVRALTDTGSQITINSFYDSASSIAIETGTSSPVATVGTPIWPNYISSLPLTLTPKTAVASTYSEIRFKIKPGIAILNTASSSIVVSLSTAFSGKASNALVYCTINNNRIPCSETITNKEFTIYASSLVSISTTSWQELVIYTQFADGDLNGFIQPSPAQSNTLTVKVADSLTSQTESRTLSVANNELPLLTITYFHTTANQFNVFSFSLKTAATTVGTTDKIVIEFPLRDYNNNPLFLYDLGSGKASGSTFYIDNYSLTGTISCILIHGDSTNNYPARIEISGYNSIAAGTTINFDVAKVKNPQTAGYDVNVAVRVYISSSSVITEERTIEYLFAPDSYATSSSCNPTAPTFSSYITSAAADFMFTCCASTDLIASDIFIVEIPKNYPFPSPASISGSFTIYKSFTSASWVALKSSSVVSCQSAPPTISFTSFTNPAYEILGNTLQFKAYVITNKTPIGATISYHPTMIDAYTFQSVVAAIDPIPPSSITPSLIAALSDYTADVQSLLLATISYTGALPAGAYFTLTLNTASDPYYFYHIQGITGYFEHSLVGTAYTIRSFSAISSPLIFHIPVTNPAAGASVTLQFNAYDSSNYLLGTTSASSTATVSGYSSMPLQSHVFRYINFDTNNRYAQFHLDFKLPASVATMAQYLTLTFDSAVDVSSYTVTTADSLRVYDGSTCTGNCISSSWITGNTLQYQFTTGSITSGTTHYIEFSGYNNLILNAAATGVHVAKLWFSALSAIAATDYYYTFYWFSVSSSGTLNTESHYGQGTSEVSVLQLTINPSAAFDMASFEFFGSLTASLGYPSALGTGLSDGAYISGMSVLSGTQSEYCVLRVSTSSLVSGITCKSVNPASISAQTFILTDITNPTSATTAYYHVYIKQVSSSSTVHSFIMSQLSISASSVVPVIISQSLLSVTIVQDVSTWTIGSMIDSNLIAGDMLLITFPNNPSAFQTSTVNVAGGTGLTNPYLFTRKPAIWVSLTANSISTSFSMNNPIYNKSNYIAKVMSFSGQTLKKQATSSNQVISAGTINTIITTTPFTPTVPFTVSLDFTVTLPHSVPLGGQITIEFPTIYYSALSCSSCSSTLMNADYKTQVSYSIATSGANRVLTITNFAALASGSFTVKQIAATCQNGGSSSVGVKTYAAASLAIDAGIAVVVVNSAALTLPGIVLLPRLSLKSGNVIAKASTVADFEFLIDPYTTINPNAGGKFTVKFPSSSEWAQTDTTSTMVCLVNGFLSHSCTRALTDITITPSTTLTAGSLYYVRLTSNNAITDGLNTPPTSGWQRVTINTYIGIPIQDSGYIDVPITTTFTSLSASLIVKAQSIVSLLQITAKLNTGISSTGSLVVEFPVFDLQTAQTQFSLSLGSSQVDGTYFQCEIFTTGPRYIPTTGVICMLEEGYQTAAITKNAKVTITVASGLSAGSTYIIGFPGVDVPSSSRGSDILVYTQNAAAVLKDYQILHHIYYVHTVTSHSTVQAGFPTIVSSKLMNTGNTYTFNFQFAMPVQTTDLLILVANINHITMSTSSDVTMNSGGAIMYSELFLYIKVGWILFRPSSLISTASVLTLTLSNINNPSYVSPIVSDYVIGLMHWNSLVSVRDNGVYFYYYSFDQSIPSPPFTLGVVTVSSFGCYTCAANIESSHNMMFYVIFAYDLNLPSGSVMQISLPSLSTEFQSAAFSCEASSTSFTSAPICQKISPLLLQISSYGTYTQNTNIKVTFKALSPAFQQVTSSGSITVFYNSGTYNIGSTSALSFTVLGPNTAPIGLALAQFSKSSPTISTRTTNVSSLKISFNPTATIIKSTGVVSIDTVFTAANTNYLCKFINRNLNYIEYISSSCTKVGTVLTANAPPNTDIVAGQVWDLEIFTFGLSIGNGFTYPAAGKTLLKVGAGTNNFEFYYEVIPAAAAISKIVSYCNTASFLNNLVVSLQAAVPDYTTANGRVEILFDTNGFSLDLGTGITDGMPTDCVSTYTSATSVSCSLKNAILTNFNYRPLPAKVKLLNQNADASLRIIKLPNVVNPALADLNINMRLRVFTLTAATFTENTVIDEMIFYTISTVTSSVSAVSANSYLSAASALSVGATNTFQIKTDILSRSLKPADSVFWRFPYALATASIALAEDASGAAQTYNLYLKSTVQSSGLIISSPPGAATYTGNIQWDFTNFVNPPFKPISPPVLITDVVVNKFHILKVTYNYALSNHIEGPVTVSQFYISGSAITPIAAYLGAKADIDIIFTIPGNMGSNLLISIDFPTTFSLDSYCQVLGTSVTPTTGDWVNCQSSSTSFLITNMNGFTANSPLQVRGWLRLPTTTGPHIITIWYYYGSTSLISYKGTQSLSISATPAHTSFTLSSFYIHTTADMPVFKGEKSRVSFPISISATITMNAGYVLFTFEPLSFTDSSVSLSCDWDDTVNIWQASSCVSTFVVATNILSVKVAAPTYNDITAGPWTVTIRGLGGNTYDGLTFPTVSFKEYTVVTTYSPDGILAALALGSNLLKTPKEPLALGNIFTYNVLMDSEIIWQMTFSPKTTLASGIPQPGGKTYMLIYFPTSVSGANCFANDFGSGILNNAKMDCYNIQNIPSIESYLVQGIQATGTPGVFYIRNYANPLTSGTTYKFYFPWLRNPVLPDVIISFHVEIWEELNTIYELKVYQEFKYCYDSKNQPVNTQSSIITYSTLTTHAQATVDFKMLLTNSITGSDPEEKIVWTLTEPMPLWPTSICTYTNCVEILNKHFILLAPNFVILNSETISLHNVNNPDDPNLSQSWTVFVFKGRILQNKLTYSGGPFSIPAPNNYASVTWRMVDDNVPNPLTSRHDRYLFRFRPSTSIPIGGSITITFPALQTVSGPPNTYIVDKACNPLHGIFGNGMKCASISTTSIKCTGFQEYHPWMPEIQIECYAKNPTVAGITLNFQITTSNAAGATLFSKTFGTFVIDAAPTELFSFRMGWPERTRATACENRNYADLYIKIVSVRGIYGTGNTLRIHLPTGVGIALDPTNTMFLECYWRNRFNKTPAEFCTYNAGANSIDVGVTDQQGLVPYGQYTVHVYTRDSTAGLYYNSFILPAFPEWESWYILATTGSKGDAAKVINEVCPVPFTSLAITPYSYTVTKWNVFDLTFRPSRDVPVGGGVVIEFRTTNELDQIFALDLGLSMDPLVLSKPVGCMVLSGFGNPAPGVVKCTAYKSVSISKTTPAKIYIRGHTTAISAASTHTIRIVKIQNPVQSTSPIHNEQLRVHFTIWTYCATSNYFQTDYARFNLDTLLNIFDYSGAKKLLNPSPVLYTNEPLTNPITTIFTVYSSPLQTSINLGVSLSASTSFVMYEFDAAFTLPTTASSSIFCNGVTTNCAIYAESLWIVWQQLSGPNPTFSMNFLDSGSNVFKSPNYESSSYKMSAYIITNGIWAEEHKFLDIPLVNRVPPTVVIAHRLSTLHRKTYDIWTITITPAKGSSRVVRIDVWFPSEFMWLDCLCTTTGLGQISTNIYPVSCTSDCTQDITKHIIITNFNPQTAVGTISLTIGAMNPATALTTSVFKVFYYSSLTDLTQIIENWSGFPVTIDNIIYPYDYWVEWPTVSIYERQITNSNYGEIWFRFRSRTGLSSTNGWYKIILPDEFDIAPSATPKCMIFHKDMPFDNYPDRWTENRTHIIVSECSYSNKVISVKFTGDILREFYGITPGICTYLILTTYPSPIDGTNGYKSALNPGCYNIQFYAMEGSNVLESAIPDICVLANPSSNMQVYSSTVDANANSILRVEFTASRDISKSYFYMAGTSPGDQSAIVIQFESYSSYAYDLAGQHDADMLVFCNGIIGLIPKVGEKLKCKLTYGIVNLPPPALQHDPAVILVSNYEAISANTFVSLHLPVIRTPASVPDTPQVTVGVYETDYTGQVTWLEYLKKFSLSPVSLSLNPLQQTVCVNPTVACSVSNPYIRTGTNVVLNFKASAVLAPGSMIVINFPAQYTTIPISGVSATIKKNPLTNKLTETYIISGINVVTYPEAHMVALTIQGTINAAENVDITLLNFTNPSFIDTVGYISYYSINAAGKIQDSFITDNIFAIFPLKPLKFSTYPAVISNSFALGTDVTFSLNTSLSIDLEAGSTITISMPSAYPALSSLIPAVSCSCNFASVCGLVSGNLVLSGYSKIPANSPILIEIQSIINPNAAVVIPQSPSGLRITAKDSLLRVISYAEFPSFRIYDKNPVQRLQAEIYSSFYEANVISTYTFSVSTMQGIPSGGQLKIVFPTEYPDLAPNERCFTSGALVSVSACVIVSKTITITTNCDISRFEKFEVMIGYVTNPALNGNHTSPFNITSYFSGNLLASLDTTDPKAKVFINPAAGTLQVVSSSFNPKNEGEMATYTFILENPVNILSNQSISLIVQFPADYPYQLIPSGADVYCDSTPLHLNCSISSPRLVKFSKLSAFTQSQTMTFNIFGVTNPKIGTTNKFSIFVLNDTTGSVLSFSRTIDFQSTSLPGILNMSSVAASSLTTSSLTDYLYTFTLETVGIKQNGGVYITWPGNYYYLLQSIYSCTFINSTDPRLLSPSCSFLVQSGNRTSIVTLSQEITPINQELFLQYTQVPTLQEDGNSGNFIISLFDNDVQAISVRSYPNLTPYPNLEFVNKGYRVFVNTTQINVYQGTYSLPILLELEKPTYDVLVIRPVPDNKGIGVTPTEMVWQYAWDHQKSFQVYAPFSVESGSYVMTWEKVESSSDPEKRQFKPLVNMVINVLKAEGSIPVTCEEISYIPIGGTSLPVKVWITLPTYEEFKVSIETTNPVQGDFIQISPTQLEFNQGDKTKYFNISIIHGAVSGYLKLSLSGNSSSSYYLVRSLIPFQTLPIDNLPPTLHSARLSSVGRTFVQLSVKSSEFVQIFYYLTRKGTQTPTVSMLIHGESMWNDCEGYFGSTWSSITLGYGEITVSGLTDSTDYVVYIVIVDRAGRPSESVSKLEFKTLETYLPARFRVYVTQVSSTDAVLNGTAKALALPIEFLISTGIDPALGITRQLQTSSQLLYYELTLYINRTLEADKPINYVKNLDYNPEKLLMYIPYYNSSAKISEHATEYSQSKATFNNDFSITSDSSGAVFVSLSLTKDGTAYGIIVAADKTTPSSIQIRTGLDGHNRKVRKGRTCSVVLNQNVVGEMNFTGLPLHQKFVVYLTAENSLPGNPKLLDDEDVKEIDIYVAGELDTSYNFSFVYLNSAKVLLGFISALLV